MVTARAADAGGVRSGAPERLLGGVVPPILTPFGERGEVDEGSLRSLATYLVGAEVEGLYVCGTTGEFPLLTGAERRRILEVVVEEVGGRIPVYAHVGAAGTAETVELARHAVSVGVDGVGAITPYFFRYDDDALRRHYLALAEAVAPLPVYLYNLPLFANNTVSPELADELYRRASNIVGLKDSSGDVEVLRAHRAVSPGRRVSLLSGTDGLNLAALELGCDGMISGNANPAPEPFVELVRACRAGDGAGAEEAQRRIDVVRAALSNGARLSDFKAVLVARGVLRTAVVRAPQPAAGDGAQLLAALTSTT